MFSVCLACLCHVVAVLLSVSSGENNIFIEFSQAFNSRTSCERQMQEVAGEEEFQDRRRKNSSSKYHSFTTAATFRRSEEMRTDRRRKEQGTHKLRDEEHLRDGGEGLAAFGQKLHRVSGCHSPNFRFVIFLLE